MDNHESRQDRDEEQRPSRRTFIKKIGTVLFSAEIVGLSASTALGQCGCGSGTRDATCSQTDSDSNCGNYYQGTWGPTYDTDESCRAFGSDEGCGATMEEDKNCSQTDFDNHCTDTWGQRDTDESCQAVAGWQDEHCGVSGQTDESCVPTINDPDQNCDVSTDSDARCGMVQTGGWDGDEDCDSATSDHNCGMHGVGGSSDYDHDQHCDHMSGNPTDQNCDELWPSFATDYSCSTSSPDENCGESQPPAVDLDEGCQRGTDKDDACGVWYVPDASCGHSVDTGHESDELCGNPVWMDTDEACVPIFPVTDTDGSCGIWGSFSSDETCGYQSSDENCTRVPPGGGNPDNDDYV
jgi:hypothetical protein